MLPRRILRKCTWVPGCGRWNSEFRVASALQAALQATVEPVGPGANDQQAIGSINFLADPYSSSFDQFIILKLNTLSTYYTMTINHIFVWASMAKARSLQAFYRTILKPIGYTELIRVNDGNLVGYGSDYPYLWLKTLPVDKSPLSTHIAFDAPSEFLFSTNLT